jgi:hypothetical protein
MTGDWFGGETGCNTANSEPAGTAVDRLGVNSRHSPSPW